MRMYRILGIILMILGVSAIGFASYIRGEVSLGKQKVRRTEKAVNTANSALSGNQTLKQVGEIATSPIQKKITEGKRDIAYYEKMADYFSLGGWVSVILGAGLVLYSFAKKTY